MFTPEELRIPVRGAARRRADIDLLHRFATSVQERSRRMAGFPVNLEFDYGPLAPFLSMHLNNAGSPGQASEYGLDTKPFEQAVTAFFIELAGGLPGEVFGHLAHGGTEANLFAAFVARERYPDGVLFASQEAHYSIPKIARLLRVPHVAVDVDERGAMDLTALGHEIGSRGVPAIVVATIGTTSRSAVDDIPGIRRAASAAGVDDVFVHSDAAFGGPLAEYGQPRRPWSFPDGADSVSISGHKIIGSPLPSSAILVREVDADAIRRPGVAVGSDDDTIGGSRDALSPLLLWYALRELGRDGLAGRVRHCLEVTEHAVRRLAEAGLNPTRFPGGNVVLFDRPDEEVMSAWHLLDVDGRAHLSVMPHVTTDLVDQLCADLTGGRA
ncbi:L-histidine carboxy-lyase (histamine-forming) [Lentzea xinjiangensis]|uniref:L-histidine carboxy-lyase (Histamine-forming) n=1 Tax=Lentzea xinjiangensis TaxID=402600 RepID=A0A1H9NLA0_9PSEU|nr:histidine decarboxylase [Lentzea xinjiangensis]SER36439.1 L-histidine carboxy-lyase (histamine-forming) [Lentzea xinjiangensis]